jgi:hypothetical protein
MFIRFKISLNRLMSTSPFLKRLTIKAAVVALFVALVFIASFYFFSWREIVSIREVVFQPAALACRDCVPSNVEIGDQLIYQNRNIGSLLCANQKIEFDLLLDNYASGDGHITVGLGGRTIVDKKPRLDGVGIIIGKASAYPGARGCQSASAKVQVEHYWSKNIVTPGSNMVGTTNSSITKGNELYPSTCSEASIEDRKSYRVVVKVESSPRTTAVQYELSDTASNLPAIYNLLIEGLPNEIAYKKGNVGWWVGHVFADPTKSWSIRINNLKLLQRIVVCPL